MNPDTDHLVCWPSCLCECQGPWRSLPWNLTHSQFRTVVRFTIVAKGLLRLLHLLSTYLMSKSAWYICEAASNQPNPVSLAGSVPPVKVQIPYVPIYSCPPTPASTEVVRGKALSDCRTGLSPRNDKHFNAIKCIKQNQQRAIPIQTHSGWIRLSHQRLERHGILDIIPFAYEGARFTNADSTTPHSIANDLTWGVKRSTTTTKFGHNTQHPTPCWRLFLNYNTRFEENFYIRGPHLRKHFFRPISTVSIVVCGTGGKRNRNPIVEITSFRPRFPRNFPSKALKTTIISSNKEPHVHIAPLTYTGIQQSFMVILAVQSIHPITACDLVGYPLLSLTDLHCHRACKAHCSTQQPRSILIFLEGANKLSTWIHNVEDLHLEVTNI